MLDQETGEYYYENVNLATGMQITKKEDVQPTESLDKFSKKNLLTITPQQGVSDNKAKTKASIATQYIGFGEGIVGKDGKRSSTQLYREQAGSLANTGNYSSDDVIFVSIPGLRGDVAIAKREQDKTIKEAIKAVEAGATILTDNRSYIESSKYNTGEQRLYKNMEAKGYNYFEITVDGQVIGTWSKTPTQPVSQPIVKPTKAPVSPAPIDSLENDMKVYAYLLNERDGVQPQYFKAGPNENRVYNLNKFGNYDLIDAVTGEIYMRNINMETGKQETEPFLNSPVDPVAKQAALDKIITLRATINIEEQLAVMGYDINDIINNLANAKTQEDFNKITKILDKLC
jgi:hypothetical protein